MSDEPSAPLPQDPALTRRSRAEPPIIDLDPSRSNASSTRTGFIASLMAGVIGGAVAGALTTGLIVTLKKYNQDDQSQRLAAIEKKQADAVSPERLIDFERSFTAANEKNAARDQLIADMNQTIDQLTQSLATLQKQSAEQPKDDLKPIITQLDNRLGRISQMVDSLHRDLSKEKYSETIRVTTGIVLALRLRDQLTRGVAYESTMDRLSALAIDGIIFDDLRASLSSNNVSHDVTPRPQTKSNPDDSLYDRLINGLSSFITITPLDGSQKRKGDDTTKSALMEVDRIIDRLIERLHQEQVTP